MAAATNALENLHIDAFFRGQTWTMPTTLYIGLATSAGSETGIGTEVSGGGYARVGVTCSLTNWAGTQGAGTTVASSGTTGTTSNNIAIVFPTPTANWGTITHFFVASALTGGTIYYQGALVTPKVVNNGDAAPQFSPGALVVQVDD